MLVFQCSERLAAKRTGSGGPWLTGSGTAIVAQLRELIAAFDPVAMLVELCGWQVTTVEIRVGATADVFDFGNAMWLRPGYGAIDDATWEVPITSGASTAVSDGAAWQLRVKLRGHPTVAERYRVPDASMAGSLRVEDDGTLVDSLSASVAIGDVRSAWMRTGGWYEALRGILAATLTATTDLGHPANNTGMLGMWAVDLWRAGEHGDEAMTDEHQEWFRTIVAWMRGHLCVSGAASTKLSFFDALARAPNDGGGRSVEQHTEAMGVVGPDRLDLVHVYRSLAPEHSRPITNADVIDPTARVDYDGPLAREGRWRESSGFIWPITFGLSIAHLAMALANERCIDTLKAIAIDVEAEALKVLDAVEAGDSPSDDAWRIVFAFLRLYPGHARLREAQNAVVAAMPSRTVNLRIEAYEALLGALGGAVRHAGLNDPGVGVNEVHVALLAVLLTEVGSADIVDFLDATGAAVRGAQARWVGDDRFDRALIDFARFHPDERVRYEAALTTARAYVERGGAGSTDPGQLEFQAGYVELCALATSCLGWDRRSVDPGNQLGGDIAAILELLGLNHEYLDALDWAAVDRDATARLHAALTADAGELINPDEVRDPVSGTYQFSRSSMQYLLLLTATSLSRGPADAGSDPTFSADVRRRFDPQSAANELHRLQTTHGVIRDILVREPQAALAAEVAAKFPGKTVEQLTDLHIAQLLDPCMLAWVATLDRDDRQAFTDARLTPFTALDTEATRDAAAMFTTRVADLDPISTLEGLSEAEATRVAALFAESTNDSTVKESARSLGTALVRTTGTAVYAARWWVQVDELARTAGVAQAQQTVAAARVGHWIANPRSNNNSIYRQLSAKADGARTFLKGIDKSKVPVRGVGALVATVSLVVRLTDDNISTTDAVSIAKDVGSLFDHASSVAGSRLCFEFADATKGLLRVPGRVLGFACDFAVMVLRGWSAWEKYQAGNMDGAVLDALNAAVAGFSAAVGLWVMITVGMTLEAPPLAMALLAIGTLITVGLWIYETFIYAPAERAKFIEGLVRWLEAIRVVYPDNVALYPPAHPDNAGNKTGAVGFYGDISIHISVGTIRLTWNGTMTVGTVIHEGDLLGTFYAALPPDPGRVFEFRAPLSGTFRSRIPSSEVSQGAAVLRLNPDFSNRRPS